jgi:hypothetical protein
VFVSGLAVALFFALPLLPEILGARRLVFRDAHITHWPWRRVAAAELAAGRVPFVNAGASGGEPLLANPNAVLLYPTLLLEKVLPAASAFNLHYLLHVLWAFAGARALARRLGQSEGAAFCAGAAFAFSGAMLSFASAFANSSAAAAWLPWCAAATVSLARAGTGREALRPLLAAAIAFGLQLLAGEPAISALTLLFCAAAGLLVSLRDRRRTGRLLAGGVLAGVGAALLAAPLYLPLSRVLPLTYRGRHLYSERAFGASPFAAWRAIEWLFPRFDGDPGALGVGAHWQHAFHEGDLVYLWCVTFGVVPLLLVAVAALSRRYWRGAAAACGAGAVVTLLLAFGSALPFYRALSVISAVRRLRYPIKFYVLTTLCVALLAGFAADRFVAWRARKREAFAIAAVVLFYAGAFFAAAPGGVLERRVRPFLEGLAAPPAALLPEIRSVFRADALLGIAAAAVLAILLYLVRPRAPALGYAFGFATLALALPYGLPLFVSADERDLERPPALKEPLAGGRVFVSPRLPEFQVLASGTAHPELVPRVARLARVQIEELIPATGLAFGARYLFDADPDGSYGWYNRLASEALAVSTPVDRDRLLRLYGARWILAEEGEDYPSARPFTGVTVAGRRLVLFAVERPLPELRWASGVVRADSLSAALAIARSAALDPEKAVVLPGRGASRDAGGEALARLMPERVDADRADATVTAATPGHVVFSRTYFPAWKARIDGRPAPVLVANARDLAVEIPPGTHRLEMWWDRAPFHAGVAFQAAALLAAIGLVASASAGARARSGIPGA